MGKAKRTGALKKGERGGVATSDVIYTDDEAEFFKAVEAWKKKTGNRFPALSELLTILRSLGYRKEPKP